MNVKKLIAVTTGAVTPLLFASQAFAGLVEPEGQFSKLTTLNSDNLGGIVSGAISMLLVVAILVSLFYLVFGGIKWVTSGGDKAKVESARNHIIAAIIGLVIAFLSFFILDVVLKLFGLNIKNLSLPKIPGL